MDEMLTKVLADPAVGAIGTAIGVAAVALWLASAWWAYSDAARRTESSFAALGAAAWVLLSSPLFLPLSLATYALVRPPVPASDVRARAIAARLTDVAVGESCPGCGEVIESEWLRCPACARWLTAPCRSCGQWSPRDLDICPFCGAEHEKAAAGEVPTAAGERGAQPRVASSMRPSLYAASREVSSTSS